MSHPAAPQLHAPQVGRIHLPQSASGPSAPSGLGRFAHTGHALRIMERCAAALAQREPVLLVGETGTGKTTTLSHLANLVGPGARRHSGSRTVLAGAQEKLPVQARPYTGVSRPLLINLSARPTAGRPRRPGPGSWLSTSASRPTAPTCWAASSPSARRRASCHCWRPSRSSCAARGPSELGGAAAGAGSAGPRCLRWAVHRRCLCLPCGMVFMLLSAAAAAVAWDEPYLARHTPWEQNT
jgi:hypothetical protein